MATKKPYTISIQDAVGFETYQNVTGYRWLDLQSTTYLQIEFADGTTLFINDFALRKVHIKDAEPVDGEYKQ